MKRYRIEVEGYWNDTLESLTVYLDPSSWDGHDDSRDETIFFYLGDTSLTVGDTITDGFTVQKILGIYPG